MARMARMAKKVLAAVVVVKVPAAGVGVVADEAELAAAAVTVIDGGVVCVLC